MQLDKIYRVQNSTDYLHTFLYLRIETFRDLVETSQVFQSSQCEAAVNGTLRPVHTSLQCYKAMKIEHCSPLSYSISVIGPNEKRMTIWFLQLYIVLRSCKFEPAISVNFLLNLFSSPLVHGWKKCSLLSKQIKFSTMLTCVYIQNQTKSFPTTHIFPHIPKFEISLQGASSIPYIFHPWSYVLYKYFWNIAHVM